MQIYLVSNDFSGSLDRTYDIIVIIVTNPTSPQFYLLEGKDSNIDIFSDLFFYYITHVFLLMT